MGAKAQTLGYRYFMSIHMGIGRGPLNEVAEIRVGDITAYDTPIDLKDSGQYIEIYEPNLFGGDKKEGGIRGAMYCYNGAADQELQPVLPTSFGILPSIAERLGGDVPNFRGVVTLWFDGMVCAMNPYPKEWSFRVRRYNAGWWGDTPWYPAKARIVLPGSRGDIHAMNGAHILYEVNTNPEWGRGMPPEMLDENSYIAAANMLCAEGLGLCIPWFRQENIKDFIPVVIDHIGGVQYVDRETGLMTLKLIRGDYNPNDLPLFTPDTGLIDILDDDNSGEETAYNEIIVKGFDPTTKEDIQVRVHNLAAIQSQGEIISNTIEYKGLPSHNLCARVAQRELKVQLPLRRMNVVLDRRGWRIAPGMPFRISHPAKGIENLILRAGECSDGTLKSGQITIKAMEDVFGMPETSFIDPPLNIWTPPIFLPLPAAEQRLYEANWRDFYRSTSTADRGDVQPGDSFVALLARPPVDIQTESYDLIVRAGGTPYDGDSDSAGWTAWLKLETDLGPLDDTLTVAQDNISGFLEEFTGGMAVLIDDEQIEFVTFEPATGIATIKRAVADTIPAHHIAGKTVWLIDDEFGTDGEAYQDGEDVFAKALTRTSTGLLAITKAPESTIEVNQRLQRPYPPGNVQVGGDSIYAQAESYPEPVLTWAHRDRILQADALVGHLEASVGPEPGVTYTIRVFGVDGTTLLREEDVGGVDTWTYDTAMQTADGSPDSVVLELESVRETLTSQFHYRSAIALNADAYLMIDGEIVEIDGEGIIF